MLFRSCARELAASGVLKAKIVRDRTGVERAGTILIDNHYGWFERVKLGHYALSPKGQGELEQWADADLGPPPTAEVDDASTDK